MRKGPSQKRLTINFVIGSFLRALRANPFDIAFELASPRINRIATKSGSPLLFALARHFRHSVKCLLRGRSFPSVQSGKILFVCYTINQRRAGEPVIKELGEEGVLWESRETHLFHDLSDALSLLFFAPLLVRAFFASRYRQRSFLVFSSDFWRSYGQYFAALIVFELFRPKLLFVANDHVSITRALLLAAQTLGIPTAYLQHASVTDKFPPLECDFAFLEGRAALDTYSKCGPVKANVFVAGCPRLDSHILLPREPQTLRNAILCVGFFDALEDYSALVRHLQSVRPDLTLALRPHPSRADFEACRAICGDLGVRFSDSRVEATARVLHENYFVICGDSNVILEERLLGCKVIVYLRPEYTGDHYQFLARGIPSVVAVKVEEVERELASPNQPELRSDGDLKYYLESMGTPWLGHSARLVAKTLLRVAEGNACEEFEEWRSELGKDGVRIFVPNPIVRPAA